MCVSIMMPISPKSKMLSLLVDLLKGRDIQDDEAILYGAISWPILDLVSRLVVTLESQYRGFFAAPASSKIKAIRS